MDGTDDPALVDSLEGAPNVLVLSPGMHADRDELCGRLLARDRPQRVLGVCYRGRGTDWVTRHDDVFPMGAFAIEVGTAETDALGVETVESADDLTGLEIAVTEALDGEPVGFCFDSLTSFLQYVDGERAHRFVHALTARVAAIGATAHFHLDPGAVDDRTRNVAASMMDAAVTLGDDGVTVRRRPSVEDLA